MMVSALAPGIVHLQRRCRKGKKHALTKYVSSVEIYLSSVSSFHNYTEHTF